MKIINLRRISEILSEKELKNVVGGGSSDTGQDDCNNACTSDNDCKKVCTHCVEVSEMGYKKYCMSQS